MQSWSIRFILCLSTILATAGSVSAAVVERIDVVGNERISVATVESYLEISRGEDVTSRDLNKSLKRLFDTGFFADVKMREENGVLTVDVLENPSIREIAFEGNKNLSSEDLEKELSLKSRGVYTRSKVQNDVERILDIYRRNGRYAVKVDPKVVQLEQNRIDVVFEIDEGPVTRIENITFIGNDAFAKSDLLEVISSTETAFYKFLSSDDIYDPDRLEYDKELMRRFYKSEGYADFNVKAAFAELSPEQDGFYLTFVVEEGPRYEFGTITMATKIDEFTLESLGDDLYTHSGERYDQLAVENTVDVMIEKLGDLGYAFVDIKPQATRNAEAQTIDLEYQVAEGPRVYVERINIDGNQRTLDDVIRREFRLVEGDAYSSTKLDRSEQRLKNLGYFKDVRVSREPGSARDRTQINVEVEEQSTGEVSFGAGFSTTDGALTDFGIRERNLLGKGQDLRFNALLAAERTQYDIGFTEPYFLGRELATGFDIYKSTADLTQESSFNSSASGGALRTRYKLDEYLTHSLRYSYDETEISGVTLGASRFIQQQVGKRATSMIGHRFTYDRRDNRFNPTEGLYWTANQEFAGLGGDDTFIRHELSSEYHIPIAEQVTFTVGGTGGHIYGFGDDIVINQRFFLGGKKFRGFDNSGVGPRDINTEDALGGNIYTVGSMELRFPLGLPDELGMIGAIFTDVGTLWNTDDVGPEVRDSGMIRGSAGVGLAWNSPFGPIRIDLALPYLKEDYDETELFQFNFGTRF